MKRAEGVSRIVGYVDGNEHAIALNQSSGELLWSTRIGAAVLENQLMRLLSQRSPTIDGERAYFATASGELVCLASRDGRELWRKNYVADFGGIKGRWGYCDYADCPRRSSSMRLWPEQRWPNVAENYRSG